MSTLLTVRSGNPIGNDDEYEVEIVDVEKRTGSNKHYVYILEVKSTGNKPYTIYRRYQEFFDLHTALVELLGTGQSMLPELPHKLYFTRSAVREVANKRLPMLKAYLKSLLALPETVTKSKQLANFLTQNISDGSPYDSQTASSPRSPRAPRKTSSEIAWKPTPQIIGPRKAPVPSKTTKGPRALVLYDYLAKEVDELTLKVGTTVSLTGKLDSNWFEGKYLGKKGVFPISYVKVIEALPRGLDNSELSDEWDDADDDDKNTGNALNNHIKFAFLNVNTIFDLQVW